MVFGVSRAFYHDNGQEFCLFLPYSYRCMASSELEHCWKRNVILENTSPPQGILFPLRNSKFQLGWIDIRSGCVKSDPWPLHLLHAYPLSSLPCHGSTMWPWRLSLSWVVSWVGLSWVEFWVWVVSFWVVSWVVSWIVNSQLKLATQK